MQPTLPEKARSPFIEGTSLQFAWDSTSMGLLKECPRKYQLSIIEGWTSKDDAVNLTFGIFYHSGIEFYEREIAQGASYEEAVLRAVRKILVDSWGWNSEDPNKNRVTLIRTLVWYFEEYRAEDAKTIILANERPAVELTFAFEIGFTPKNYDQPYLLCGHLDRVVSWNGDTYILDHKTSKASLSQYYFDQYSPDNQMTTYIVASQVVFSTPVKGILIDGAQVAVGFSAFRRGFTYRSSGQIDEWLEDLKWWFRLAEVFVESNYWPMNDKSCHKYGGCQFREVCNKDPSIRKNFLETKFKKRFWNPLEAR